jgi:RNA polymerase sigma-70 factor (ECF subfamily)
MQTAPESRESPFVQDPQRIPYEELVLNAKAGDRDQLEVLLTRHLPWLFNLAPRMLHRRADAEDATQEILLKALKVLPQSRGNAKFSTWLRRIAVNHLLNVN